MTMDDFYIFLSKGYLTTFSACPDIFEDASAVDERGKARQIMADLIKGHADNYSLPLIFHQMELGNKLRDVLDIRYVSAYLISDRMRTLLEENHVTGWTTYPIILYDRKGRLVPGYHGFSITGRAGKMDFSKQPLLSKTLREGGPVINYYKGVYFDINSWDGSDFFILADSYGVVVTKRVADLLKRNKITAIDLEKLSDFEMS